LYCPEAAGELNPCSMEESCHSRDPLPILYQDDRYVAVHKPAGLLVHRTPMDRGETVFCLQLLRDQLGRTVFPCHRLDKPTSGILLFALDHEALEKANRLWREDGVRKHYQALVRGWLEGEGLIDHPLRVILDSGKASGEFQDARTGYRGLQAYKLDTAVGPHPTARYSLVELIPRTGRTHQLRRHMKHLSHPIVGDTRYGDGRHNRVFRERFACHRLLLASIRLSFVHPYTQETLCLECPPEESFSCVLRQLPLRA